MKIESTKVIVNASPEVVMHFLSDARNIEYLLPTGKISDFKATEEECSFKVQGGVIISLIEDGKTEFTELYLKSGKGTPFPFRLTIALKDIDKLTEGQILFDGEVNMFLKMMVEKPLTALFNYMSEKLKDYYDQNPVSASARPAED
ncbi:MAG: hypothetical protein V4638_05195 [Bacteroidota bacterium]